MQLSCHHHPTVRGNDILPRRPRCRFNVDVAAAASPSCQQQPELLVERVAPLVALRVRRDPQLAQTRQTTFQQHIQLPRPRDRRLRAPQRPHVFGVGVVQVQSLQCVAARARRQRFQRVEVQRRREAQLAQPWTLERDSKQVGGSERLGDFQVKVELSELRPTLSQCFECGHGRRLDSVGRTVAAIEAKVLHLWTGRCKAKQRTADVGGCRRRHRVLVVRVVVDADDERGHFSAERKGAKVFAHGMMRRKRYVKLFKLWDMREECKR